MFLCGKRVNTLQRRSVKIKYCKKRIGAKVGVGSTPHFFGHVVKFIFIFLI